MTKPSEPFLCGLTAFCLSDHYGYASLKSNSNVIVIECESLIQFEKITSTFSSTINK